MDNKYSEFTQFAQFQRDAIRQDFAAQPVRGQRETLDRILDLLVAEYERDQKSHSALWQNMGVYGFTPYLVQLESERRHGG